VKITQTLKFALSTLTSTQSRFYRSNTAPNLVGHVHGAYNLLRTKYIFSHCSMPILRRSRTAVNEFHSLMPA